MADYYLDYPIRPIDSDAQRLAVDHWNNVAKPIGSLGALEDIVVRIAGIQATSQVHINKRAVLAMCADNGVVEEGVTQSGQEVTTLVASNMARNCSSVCVMAKTANIDVFPVDMGMVTPAPDAGIINRSLGRGTANIAKGPAMTRAQALQAIDTGVELVGELASKGYDIIATGEMGIGNTTPSSAVASVMLDFSVEELTGRGAGLSSEGLGRKVAAIYRAIEVNHPDPDDPLEVLHMLGGFDIAGMVGTYVGGAVHGVPILIDGLISSIAALIAVRIEPRCRDFMIATHCSAEPAALAIMDDLGLTPIIHAGMRLGEGTGAITLIPMLDMALALYNGTTFEATGMDAYDKDLK